MLEPASVISIRVKLGRLGGVLSALFFMAALLSQVHAESGRPAIALYRDGRTCEEILASYLPEHFRSGAVSRIGVVSRVSALYSRYAVENLISGDGYFFRLRHDDQNLPMMTIPIEESKQLWKMSDLKAGDKRYQLLDSGFKWLARESNLINYGFMTYAEQFPGRNFQLRFTPEHAAARRNLYYMRFLMHDAVLKKYAEKKKYLSSLDYAQLSWATGWSDNSDAFALLEGDPMPAEGMSLTELHDRIALTLQVTYYGKRDFFKPDLRGGLAVNGVVNYEMNDMLPFEFRIRSDKRDAIARAVYTRFDRGTTCEVTRYVRFADDLPREAHDKLLLAALERLEGRGMRTILASTDALTMRLFSRYGFQKLLDLPTSQDEEKEFLTYLEVGSPQYEKLKEHLKQSAKQVAVGR